MTERPAANKPFEDGPAQLLPAPDTLAGHVVDWRDGGAIHGVGVLDDLAVHYAPHEVLLLGLTGTEPSKIHGRAFGVALTLISASHVGTAPTHSAVLARVSGAPTSGIIATAGLVAAREAEHVLTTHEALITWLDQHDGQLDRTPGSFSGWAQRDPSWRRRVLDASGLDLPALDVARDEASAALIVFHQLGLRRPAQLVAAWSWARMIGSLAESLAEQGLDIRSYPLRLPHYDYIEDDTEDVIADSTPTDTDDIGDCAEVP
ncbi:hypothetical protein [Enhygromyxa salina]|uniref:Uncharacterized protein n=1 Tax=Enhygromyxa salina TaxID=215803 RepID=A0A2S9YSH5_9BACT|nr:hypothetical protein [Enhygromyxa salina]PRQ08002.1 hypothetical protein ENSA7_22860 [Enhygromyxa salina]